jgi:hypothetical protein
MSSLAHKPPIFCQKCHCKCHNTVVGIYINRDAEIIFEFACLKCGTAGEIQTFKMNFTQTVAYCISVENNLACYSEGPETIQ